MIEAESHTRLKRDIAERIAADRGLLDQLREEIRPLRNSVRRIQPRTTTSISLVGTDGGNNRIRFDPFLIQLIRVVDSSNNEYCLEAITPTTSVAALSARQFDSEGRPCTALGAMMEYLDVRELPDLTRMIRSNEGGRPTSASWVQVYRELIELATLFQIVRTKSFGTDTVIVFDGLLRSVVFAKGLFTRYLQGIAEGIARHQESRRKIHLVGVAKQSKALSRYRLAMLLEHVLTTDYPAYVEIPSAIEKQAYVWSEYTRDDNRDREFGNGAEINTFVGGKMFFVKFGNSPHDPIRPVDIFLSQAGEAPTILGSMLADAEAGFPIPMYPRCLQKAHENAALVDFDFDILQDEIVAGIRTMLGNEARTFDAFRLQDQDPALGRYE